jgi:hypothetical protein
MKRFAHFTCVLAGLAACEPPPSAPAPREPIVPQPSFAQVFHQKEDVFDVTFYECTPEELVQFQGLVHTHTEVVETPTSTRLTIHTNSQGLEGVGLTSGDRYSVADADGKNETIEFASGSSEGTFVFRRRLIRHGSGDNAWVSFEQKFSFPPLAVEIIKLRVECHG